MRNWMMALALCLISTICMAQESVSLPASTTVDVLRYQNETFVKVKQSNKTWTAATDQNAINMYGKFIPDSELGRYATGTTQLTANYLYATTLWVDTREVITMADGSIFAKLVAPVGGRPGC